MVKYPINKNPILPPKLSNKIGVYVIFARNEHGAIPISRVLDIDCEGRLYIGQTSDTFEERLQMFKRVMKPNYKSTGHSGALNLKEIELLRNKFTIETIYVGVIEYPSPKELEEKMLEEHRQEFGEVPPLNNSK